MKGVDVVFSRFGEAVFDMAPTESRVVAVVELSVARVGSVTNGGEKAIRLRRMDGHSAAVALVKVSCSMFP